MQIDKTYPAAEVVPFKSGITALLRRMKPEQAINLPIEKRKRYQTTISRLHAKGEGKYRTVMVSPTEFAVIKDE